MAIRETIEFNARDNTRQGMNSVTRGLSGVQRATLNVQRSMQAISGAVIGLTATMAAFGAAATQVTRASVRFADEIAKTARVVGVSSSALQELRFAAEQTGIEARGLDDSLRRLQRRAGEFANSGAGPAQKAFEKLGISVRDAAGNVKDNETLFNDIVRSLQNVGSDAEKAAFAAQLFGDDFGPKLVPLLNLGIDGINNLRTEAQSLGIVLSDELAGRAEVLADQMNIFNRVMQTQFASIVLENADAINALMQSLIGLIPPLVNGTARLLNFIGVMKQLPISVYEENIAILGQRLREADADIEASNGRNKRAAQLRKERLVQELREQEDLLKAARARMDQFMPSFGALDGVDGAAAASAAASTQEAAISRVLGGSLPEQYSDGGYLDNLFSFEKLEAARDKMMEVTDEMTVYSDQAARNMQTAFADFLFNPFENSLKDMLKNFARTLQRMAAEIASQQILKSLFSSMAGSSTGWIASLGAAFGGPKAMGGPVTGGTPYLVGERGPELFVPGMSGNIVPNHAMGAGSVVVNIDARQTDDPARLLALAPVIANQVEQSIALKMRRGYL